MKKKVVQVIAPCWVNKGDRLMVNSLYQELGQRYYLPVPLWNMVPASRFYSPVNMYKMGIQSIKRFFQYRSHGTPDVLLDGSGFQLGDPWAKMSSALSMRLMFYQHYKKKGVKLIMLPQSMGPFKNPIVASNAAGIMQLADLVFVRCNESKKYALSVGCPESKLFVAPDYSNMVAPILPQENWSNTVCLVPSMRMMDKTSKDLKNSYLKAMYLLIDLIRERGLTVCLLVHQEEDRKIAEDINKNLPEKIRLVDPLPREAKGILASCRAVIASRYHSIVSALSQATPVIGTGWTHKYQALFDDYNSGDYLLKDFDSSPEIEALLDRVLDEENRSALIKTLQERGDYNRKRTKEMYSRLVDTIEK